VEAPPVQHTQPTQAATVGVIVSGILSAEGMNFAIPVDMAIEFVRRMLPRF
jgi:S1-C subfamily serine protease